MAEAKKGLKLLFERPREPVFMPKGENNTVFQITPEYLTPQYQDKGVGISTRFGEPGETINLSDVSVPDLSLVTQLGRDDSFSLFVPKHQKIAGALIDIFMKVPNNELQKLLELVAYVRDRVNPQLFNYALSVAILHREDTRDVSLPNYMEIFPSRFTDSSVFVEAREISTVVPIAQRRTPIVIPKDFTASDLDLEHRVAYFREDIGINLHHWHWHLVYPFMSANLNIVNKNRRGELFYYMHQQVVARYNAERFCNMLPRVKRFINFREQIPEGYYPKLDSLTSGRGWPPRQSGATWSDLNRTVDEITMNIDDIVLWKNRIEEAISTGQVLLPNGSFVPLDIDTLGNMIEASQLTPNAAYYGNLHNGGHLFSAYTHDPRHKYLERFGVMGDSGTAMRDPIFYRWHATIDDLFQKFKANTSSNPTYTRAQLVNPNISVTSFTVGQGNRLTTFWMESDVDMSRGLDFSERGPVLVRFTHLNYKPFSYKIAVNNTGATKFGTVRIFMAPKNDERGLPFVLREQRNFFIELDRFVAPIQRGRSTIERNSEDSSVTIPFERTFRDLSSANSLTGDNQSTFNFCGCGWPQHMLLPKSTPQGTVYQFFVMISNYDQDRIDQNLDGVPCADASSYCGIKDNLYPDRRAMGYPFDRPPNPQFGNIRDFIQSNMAVQDVTIKFSNNTEKNPRNPNN